MMGDELAATFIQLSTQGYDMRPYCQGFLLLVAFAGLAACGGSSGSGETGRLSLGVSDHPIHSAQKVCITFDDIELKPAGDGPAFLVPLPETKVNLLAFQGMNAAPLLFQEEVPAGEYAWMRLVIDASEGISGGAGDTGDELVCDGQGSYIVMDDSLNTVHNLYIPSGSQTGLKLSGFTVPVNGDADFTAEWDLMKSITAPSGPPSEPLPPDVILNPHIRLVNNVEVGAVLGLVSSALADVGECAPAVYVFDNANPNASDVDVGEPVASGIATPVDENDLTRGFEYEIGQLVEGSYEVAFSCDELVFVEPGDGNPFEISAGAVVEISFP